MNAETNELNDRFKNEPIETVLADFLEMFKGKIALATSFGAEDQILTDLILKNDPEVKIFSLDTGRLPEETYVVMERTNRKYGIQIDVYFPDANDVEELYRTQGINGFRNSVESRKACCYVRKIAPLQRALDGIQVWITGLRRSQSPTRESMEMIEWDAMNKILKLNPLIEWDDEAVWTYIHMHKVPYNVLHDCGYPSIGCAPCTRAVEAGEDIRAGRWWWENPEHKECGLHGKGVER